MEDLDSSVSMQSLVCQDDHTLRFDAVVAVAAAAAAADHNEAADSKPETSMVSNGYVFSDLGESYIEILVSKESTFDSADRSSSLLLTDTWLKCVRSNAIQWIIRTKDYFGFSFETAYLSITYLDRFLMRRNVDKDKPWAVRLLSAACLSLAAKMEERVVPALPEYDTDGRGFESDAMKRMELLVLSTLDWRMGLATPFAYLNHFAFKLQHYLPNKSDKLVSKSVGYIFSIIEDINLVDYRASAVAAAAILAASEQRLTNNLLGSKLSILSSCGGIEIENVLSCYALMTRQSQEGSVPSESFVCSESSMNCADNRSSKRRRRRRRLQ